MVRRRIAFLMQAAVSALATGCTTVVGGSASPADTSGPLSQTPVAPAVRNNSAIQAVIAYPSAPKANTFYEASVRRWFGCANRTFAERPTDKPEIVWKVGEAHKVGGTLSTSEVQEDSNGWTCQRALTARNNVVIDIATCGSFLPGGSAVDLAEQIAAKVARQ